MVSGAAAAQHRHEAALTSGVERSAGSLVRTRALH